MEEQLVKYLEGCGYRRDDPDFQRLLGLLRAGITFADEKLRQTVDRQRKAFYSVPQPSSVKEKFEGA